MPVYHVIFSHVVLLVCQMAAVSATCVNFENAENSLEKEAMAVLQPLGAKRRLSGNEDIDMTDVVRDDIKPKRKKRRRSNLSDLQKNPLMFLNERRPDLVFVMTSQEGPPHAPTFAVTVDFDSQSFKGTGPSKQKAKLHAAEQIIAEHFMTELTQLGPNEPPETPLQPETSMTIEKVQTPNEQENTIIPNNKPPIVLLNEIHKGKIDYKFDEEHVQSDPFVCSAEVNGKLFVADGISKKKAKAAVALKVLQDVYEVYKTGYTSSENFEGAATENPQKNQLVVGEISEEEKSKNPVMLLNEKFQGKVDYQIEVDSSQPDSFVCTVEVNGKEITASGISKKKAKINVASKVIEEFYGVNTQYTGTQLSPKVTNEPQPPQPPDSVLDQRLADTIALMTLNKFKELSQGTVRCKVLAGIVMTRQTEDGEMTYNVISLGTGTKLIGGEYISEQGYAVNDCHGEIISRRGLRRFLYSQLDECLQGQINSSVLEKKQSGLFGLKNGIGFHLYISTSPCGDARVYSPHEAVTDIDKHPARKNRGLLRVKLENGEGTIPVANFENPVQTWDGLLGSEKLRTMSCSDKISKWNILGVQGSLLSNFIEPVYLKSITLGSLYRYDHMSRAMYDRLGFIPNLPEPFLQHKPLMSSISSPEARQPGKAPKTSINWTIGDEAIETLNTLTGKLAETNQPSRLCKQAMFASFCKTWHALQRNQALPENYQEAKHSCQSYQQAKETMVNTFSRNGLGIWAKKPVEQDWFPLIGST